MLGGTQLTAIQPHTDNSHVIYPRPGATAHERPFYTQFGGKSQLLLNGHWIITEAGTGRVFEIDRDGRTVWEWGQERRSDGMVAEVLEGTRYSLDRNTVASWSR